MGPIGIHGKDAEDTAEAIVRLSSLKGCGDHGRPMMFWKRQMLDSVQKGQEGFFQGCSIGCLDSLLMVVFQSSPMSMLGHYGLVVGFFTAGKNSKDSSHQDHQGPCEEQQKELEKGHSEGHLRAACCCQWDTCSLLFAVLQGRTMAHNQPRDWNIRGLGLIEGKTFFPQCMRMSKEVVQSLSLEVFKTQQLHLL